MQVMPGMSLRARWDATLVNQMSNDEICQKYRSLYDGKVGALCAIALAAHAVTPLKCHGVQLPLNNNDTKLNTTLTGLY